MVHTLPQRTVSPINQNPGDGDEAELFGATDNEEEVEVANAAGQGLPQSSHESRNIPKDLVDHPYVLGPPPSIDIRSGGDVIRAQPRRAPREPTQQEYDEHMLTHADYRSWCPFCPAAARPNDPHLSLPAFDRQIPLFVADYCFLRSILDDSVLPTLVGRLYPFRAVCAIPCDTKGCDEYAVSRLADFFKTCGMSRIVYMSDQENALRSVIDAALNQCSKSGEWVGGVPEMSAVGESQSNGRAERTVQIVEDKVRTHKAALEARIGARIPVDHPVMRWMVEYVGVILNKYVKNDDGCTPYEDLHGHPCRERLVEFGERVLFHIPKVRRAKLDLRWASGVFLGTTMSSNECWIGLANGNVTRARSIMRLTPERRWSMERIQNITGTPLHPNPLDTEHDLDRLPDHHANADDTLRDADADAPGEPEGRARPRLRITLRDLNKYGFTEGCPRCTDLQAGKLRTNSHHSAQCRERVEAALQFEDAPKWRAWQSRNMPLAPAAVREGEVEPLDVPVQVPRAAGSGESAARQNAERPLQPPTAMPAPQHRAGDEDYMPDDWTGIVEPDMIDDNEYDGADAGMDIDAMYGPDSHAMLVDCLVAYGVEPTDAIRAVRRMHGRGNNIMSVTEFVELYGSGNITAAASIYGHLNVAGLRVLDLRGLREDGLPWDFTLLKHRQQARKLIKELNPDWVIGAPPCGPFSRLNVNINHPRMSPKDVDEQVTCGKVHLEFAMQIYRDQLSRGRYFLHEHPATAESWKHPGMTKLLSMPGVNAVVTDQCMYNNLTVDENKEQGLSRKPTRFVSNSAAMLEELSLKCDGKHRHIPLEGGRAGKAAIYPLRLIRAIITGMARTREAEQALCAMATDDYEATLSMSYALSEAEDPPDPSTAALPETSIPLRTGGELRLKFNLENFKPVYRDEYTAEELPNDLVHKAMCEELMYFNSVVWELVDVEEAKKAEDYKLIRTKWVVCNKGDMAEPDVRARLVACEVNTFKSDLFHAATPPLESKKLLFSQYASQRVDENGAPLNLMFIDVRKAYFNATPKRVLHLLPPRELGLPKRYVARLKRCAYGTRDAGLLWEETYCEKLVEMGFERGASSPCCFYHRARGIRCVVHGDDFTLLGNRDQLEWFRAEFGKAFEIKVRGVLGEDASCQKEIRILNRVLRVEGWGLAYEADPRHAELLANALDIPPRQVSTPGVKDGQPNLDAELNHEDEIVHNNDEDLAADAEILRSDPHPLLSVRKPSLSRVKFSPSIVVHEISPYAELWHMHPRRLVVDKAGLKVVSEAADPFTGKSSRVMRKRRGKIKLFSSERVEEARRIREQRLSTAFRHGSAWEAEAIQQLIEDRDELCMALRTPSSRSPAAKKGRMGAKAVKKIEHKAEAGELLSPSEATTFRALSARANFLAQDRPDLAFSCKELCRHFSCPTTASLEKLRRLVLYLIRVPRLIYAFKWQQPQDRVTIFADTDFAGCNVTRRSTSGGCVMLGSHLVKHYASTQTTISLSSGEAELHGIAKAASHAIGVKSLLADLGYKVSIDLYSDAIAAIGIARRRGVGRIRHLDTTDLWIQEKVKSGEINLIKILGTENPADLFTKYLPRPEMLKHMSKLSVEQAEGRALAAPKLTAAQSSKE